MTIRRIAFGVGAWLLLFPLMACSDLPTSPDPPAAAVESNSAAAVKDKKDKGEPPAPLDLEAALNDALLLESLAGLEDPDLADELADGLDTLLDLVEEPDSRDYASALAHVRQLVDDHLADPNTSAEDQIALSVLDVTLLSI